MVTDSIADFIIRIKNGNKAGSEVISMPSSKMKESIANILEKEGFISSIAKKKKKNQKILEITLKYDDKKPRIADVKRVSKLSKRVYVAAKDIKPFKNNLGISIISTSKGLMTGLEAKKANLGGEFLFNIW